MHGPILLQAKQIRSNCFVLPVLEWILLVLDLGPTKIVSNGSHQRYCPSSVNSLISVSQKPGDNSDCDITYGRLFFYHQWAHASVYTRNTDNRLVEQHCPMFWQGSLAFSINHLSNLMHDLQVCLCCKTNIFSRFDSKIEMIFQFPHKYLIVDLNEWKQHECD